MINLFYLRTLSVVKIMVDGSQLLFLLFILDDKINIIKIDSRISRVPSRLRNRVKTIIYFLLLDQDHDNDNDNDNGNFLPFNSCGQPIQF